MRSFVGLCSYYRRFVKDFAEIAASLHKLTVKSVVFQWTPACQAAFDSLKAAMVNCPILAMPTVEEMYVLDTDASNHSIGAVLSQIQSRDEWVIAYGSRTYGKAEINYRATREELLVVVYFMKLFKQYLLIREFLVRTDHAALTWLQKAPEMMNQTARWQKRLQELSLKIQHRPGMKHGNADFPSEHTLRQFHRISRRVPA